MRLSVNTLRRLIKEELTTSDEINLDDVPGESNFSFADDIPSNDEEVDETEPKSVLDSASSFSEKARIIFKILSSSKYLGSDIEKIIGIVAGKNIIRFGINTDSDNNHDFGILMNMLYKDLYPEKKENVIELAPDESPNPSGSYQAYLMPEIGNLILLFGFAGNKGGQRKEGYIYEDSVLKNLELSGLSPETGPDNSYSDIYIQTANGTIGIEVKLPNAQAGEPTLRYDFDTSEWFASNPKPQNKDISDLINLDKNSKIVKSRLEKVRDAINIYRAQLETPVIESILSKINKAEYNNIVKPVLAKEATGDIKGALLATYTVSADVLRTYYMLKSAGLVQVKTKGLFHLHPDFKVSITMEDGSTRTTSLFEFPKALGAVYFRNFKGNNYGIRAQLKNAPLKKLNQSAIDLDRAQDRDIFSKSIANLSFPDAKTLAKDIKLYQEMLSEGSSQFSIHDFIFEK